MPQPPSPSPSSGGPILSPPQSYSYEEIWDLYSSVFTRFVLAVGMVHCFTEYVAEITLCEGPSMHPTLKPSGEIVLIDKFTLNRIHGRARRRNDHDVAIISQGEERLKRALQRQEAFEKQQLSAQNASGNGKTKSLELVDEWHEPRISVSDIKPTWSMVWQALTSPLSVGDVVVLEHPNRKGTVCKRVLGLPGDTVLRPRKGLLIVPDGHMWVEGDNPANSSDSRTYGAVPMTLIQGRVLCRIWPLRGNALLMRGAPPRPEEGRGRSAATMGYTILPAGYEGQHIVKTVKKNPASTAT